MATGNHRLPARHVVHAGGPPWQGGGRGEPELLASAWTAALALAAQLGCATVAAPSISTGGYGFSVECAAPIAVAAITVALMSPGTPLRVCTIACFSDEDLAAYHTTLIGDTDDPGG